MYSGNHKISYGCKKFTRHSDFKILWRSTSFPCAEWKKGGGCAPLQHPTKPLLVQEDSTPATLKFPSVTFSIEKPCNKITIMHRIIYYQNYAHLVAKSIFSRNSSKQFKPSNSINLCTNLQEKTLITIHYSP